MSINDDSYKILLSRGKSEKEKDYRLENLKGAGMAQFPTEILLTPIQKWFFEIQKEYPNYWNQANLFEIDARLDLELLESVFRKVLEQHDTLRIGYMFKDGAVVQYNRDMDEVDFKLDVYDLSDYPYEIQKEKIREQCETIRTNFNLESGLLFNASVFELGCSGKRLFIAAHHLLFDGASWRILLDDIYRLYKSRLALNPLLETNSFKDWSTALYSLANEQNIDIKYWAEIDVTKIKSWIKTREGENYSQEQKTLKIELDKDLTHKLINNINPAYETGIKDILLASLLMAWAETAETDHILLMFEGSGREDNVQNVDLTRTIGCFTDIYPIFLEKKDGLRETIIGVKENLRGIPRKGLNFGIAKYLKNDRALDSLKPEISFNFLEQFDIGDLSFHDILKVCGEDVGITVHPWSKSGCLMNIEGMVIGGKLKFTIVFNPEYIDNEIVKFFCKSFKIWMIDIIGHCMEAIAERRLGGQGARTPQEAAVNGNSGKTQGRAAEEKLLVGIWEKVLGIRGIGIDDDFFEIGGGKVKAEEVVNVAQDMNIPLSLSVIVKKRTIAKILSSLNAAQAETDPEEGPLPKGILHAPSPERLTRVGSLGKVNFNARFSVEKQLYYFDCFLGSLIGKLRYENDFTMESSFLSASYGDMLIGCGFIKDLQDYPVLLGIPGQIAGYPSLHDFIGVDFTQKTFECLEKGLSYLHETLGRHKVVILTGSTYYLHHTPGYHLNHQTLVDLINRNEIVRTVLRTPFIPTLHTVLLFDLTEQGYWIYDTTFSYFGVVPAPEFMKFFEGLRAIDDLKGHPVYQSTAPYQYFDIDAANLKSPDLRSVALDLLKLNIQKYLESPVMEDGPNAAVFGIKAMEKVRDTLGGMTAKQVRITGASIGALIQRWAENFALFRNFLLDVQRYHPLPDTVIHDFNRMIKDTYWLALMFKEFNGSSTARLLGRITLICDMQKDLFENLNQMAEQLR